MTPQFLSELTIENYPYCLSKGGQSCGHVKTGIRVTHNPSGTIAVCQSARSQQRNKDIAVDMILSALTHPRFEK